MIFLNEIPLDAGLLRAYWMKGSALPPSDEIMIHAAKKWCAFAGHAPFSPDILRPEFEKPRFVHAPDVHFSITHSGDYWMCAMDIAPVGIDLQLHQKADFSGIARRHFHPLEAAHLEKHPDDFFRVWTAKEAFVKCTGKGIDNDFDAFSVCGTGGLLSRIGNASLRFIPFAPGYTLSMVSAGR